MMNAKIFSMHTKNAKMMDAKMFSVNAKEVFYHV